MVMTSNDKMKLACRLAWVAAVFCLLISVMLVVNYIQLKSVNPLESPALNILVEQLHRNPDDEVLKESIRSLDLMIRKAYFTSQWQIRTGTWMLIAGTLVMVLSLRWQKSLHHELDELATIEKNLFLDKHLARKGIIYAGLGIFGLAILSGMFSKNILDQYDPTKSKQELQASSVEMIVAQPVAISKSAEGDSLNTETPQKEVSKDASQVVSVKTIDQGISSENEIKNTGSEAPKINSPFPATEQIRNNYPFFRGPDGDGITYKTNVPISFDGVSGNNVLWKVKVPKHGFNSPIIWNDRLFLTGADNKARMVYCYEKNSGKLLWEAIADNIPGSPVKMPNVTEDTGLAASTMATNGQSVFAIFATGDVLALDFSGKRIWAKNLGVPDNHYGHSSSLIIYKDNLLIQYDTNKGGKLIALSTTDGTQKWETIRQVKISWASPVLVNTGKREEVILNSQPLVAGYDPETGKELWTVDCMMGEVGASVGYANGIVYAANEYATMAAIKLGATPEIIWEEQEYLPEVASPLAANELLIVATSYGVLACYDAVTGEKYWEHEAASGFYASPVYADGNVYAIDMSGNMYVMKMAKEFTLISESKLGEKVFGTPVFSDGKMFLRGVENLYCIAAE